ncbi:MAG: aminotransferase class V-fold PLP-dependent enzyme [Gammaproteobacteria bacterium]|nr:aminotransferase class V-fold PLP-dependent enzyme [Gammaproteobacteria bacterium]
MTRSIYLDYAATTPVDPAVITQMLKFLGPNDTFGNPASSHSFGQTAKKAVDHAREQIAAYIHALPDEIIFTSGATESINLAIKGAAELYQTRGRHIVTLKTEHQATLDACQWLEKNGYQVTYLATKPDGLLDLAQLEAALRDDTVLVSILQVNNETGVIQDITSIAAITQARGILLHVDGAQTVGKTTLDVSQTPVDLVSLSAHKAYGPKGVGALYLRSKPKIRVAAQIHGGGHQKNIRSGTLATHQIVGMGEAFAIAKQNFAKDRAHIQQCREQFLNLLSQKVAFQINGNPALSVPNTVNIRFENIELANAIKNAADLAVSAGSACHSKGVEPSHVLRAMGLSFFEAHCSLRFSFGRFTTEEEIVQAIKLIANLGFHTVLQGELKA